MMIDFKEKIQFNDVHIFKETENIKSVKYLSKSLDQKRSINVGYLIGYIESNNNYNQILFNFFQQCGYENNLCENFLDSYLEKKSLINFIRYFNELEIFLKKRDFFVDLTDLGFLNIRLMSRHKNTGYLELTFNKNGKVDYLSLDKEYDPLERKTFVMRGYIETSSILKKSYKFNRLLCILNHMDLENKEFNWNFID